MLPFFWAVRGGAIRFTPSTSCVSQSSVVETFSLVFRAFISQISVKFRCHKSFRMSQPSWSSFTQHWRIKLLWMPQNESAEEIWVLRLFILKLRSCYEWIHEMGRFIHWGNQVASKSCTFGNDLCGVIRFIHCDFLLRQYNQIVFGLRLRFTSYVCLRIFWDRSTNPIVYSMYHL